MTEESFISPHRSVAPEERMMHYQKIYHVGDNRISHLLDGPICVEEKVDGSQFRFMVKDGVLLCGSHNIDFTELRPADNMFLVGVEYLEMVKDHIPEGFVFFAELLSKPKQNTITYSHVPDNHLMLFDAYNYTDAQRILPGTSEQMPAGYAVPAQSWVWPTSTGRKTVEDIDKVTGNVTVPFFEYGPLRDFAAVLGIDGPNIIWAGDGREKTYNDLVKWLATDSYLGGSIVEGVVVKNYSQLGGDQFHPGLFLAGKMVRESFKEENALNWSVAKGVEGKVIARFKTDARYEKAAQHLKESGSLEWNLRDIKGLMDAVRKDVLEECRPEIERMLWEHFERNIMRGIVSGIPEWYKTKLGIKQFDPMEKQ